MAFMYIFLPLNKIYLTLPYLTSTFFSRNSVNGALTQSNSLGRDCHDGQVAPDHHQSTVRQPIKNKPQKIATWNVRSLYQNGKFENVESKIKRMEIDILGLTEVRWKVAGEFTSDNHKILYSGGNQHHRGVGIILSPNTVKTLKGCCLVSDPIIAVTLSVKPFDISIIQIYASTVDHDDIEIEAFYEIPEEALKQLKSSDIKIIMGDFNAKLGDNRIGNIVWSTWAR